MNGNGAGKTSCGTVVIGMIIGILLLLLFVGILTSKKGTCGTTVPVVVVPGVVAPLSYRRAGLAQLSAASRTSTDTTTTTTPQAAKVVRLYYANWCGYCTRFKPEWEKLKAQFANDGHWIVFEQYEHGADAARVSAARVDNQSVAAFPTVSIGDAPNGSETQIPGALNAESIATFLLQSQPSK